MNDERIDETDPDEEYPPNPHHADDLADATALALYDPFEREREQEEEWLNWFFKQVDCE
jgi:hypothetical protein